MRVGGEAHLVKCRVGQRNASQEVMKIQQGDEGTVLGTWLPGTVITVTTTISLQGPQAEHPGPVGF